MAAHPVLLLRFAALLAAAGVAASAHAAATQPESDLAVNVEAQYLYQLTRYVEWPERAFPSTAAPFVIAVVGKDPRAEAIIASVLRQNATVADRRLQVVFVKPGEPLPAAAQIAFVLRSAPLSAAELRLVADDHPLLLVGERPGFAEHGGVVNFIFVEGQIKLEANPDRAQELGLHLSGALGRSCILVHNQPGELP